MVIPTGVREGVMGVCFPIAKVDSVTVGHSILSFENCSFAHLLLGQFGVVFLFVLL